MEAANRGRTACEVTSWGLELPDQGNQFFLTHSLPESSPSQVTIDGLHHAKWFVPLGDLAANDELLEPEHLRVVGLVTLGTGERVHSKPYTIPRATLLEERGSSADGDS